MSPPIAVESEPSPAARAPSPRLGRERIERLAARVAAPAARPRIAVRMPFTGELLGEVPRATPADLRAAFARARTAQDAWAHRELAERTAVFVRFHDLLIARQDEALDLIQLETGKARKHAFEEVVDAAVVARYYAVHAEDLLAPKRRKGALPGLTAAYEHRLPKGVVGLIAPWNYPLTLSVSDSIPALIAGNAVVAKPDSQTPFTALWAAELLAEAGLPEDLFQIVTGEGPELGPALIEESDYVSFTGSTATGRKVARQAGEQLVGCSLELGGKNAMLVLADADLEAAVAGAERGCFSSAGQLCISIERLFVHASLYPRFLQRFVEAAQLMKLGAGLDYDTDMGSLISAAQLAKVEEHVQDAVRKGATVHHGGRRRPDLGPYFYEPTILSGVTPEMKLYAEETFGPVVAVSPFETVNEAVERANATAYGLNASVWTRDTELGHRVATRLRTGTVNVNDAYAAAWCSVDSPMGGMKQSGLGRRHGAEGMLRYTDAQTVAIQRGLPLAAPAGVREETWSKALSQTLKLLRHVPGLR
jgi:succinate-semialdehyde dehydrogenase/glutarate-semialdehyde dehydrogenase